MYLLSSFFLIILASSLPYFELLSQYPFFSYSRDLFIIGILIFIFSNKKIFIRNHVVIIFVIFIAVFTLTIPRISLDSIQYFSRNLFFYGIAFLCIFDSAKLNSKYIFYSIPFLDILGLILQKSGHILSPFEERYIGFFISPTVVGFINLLFLVYINIECKITKIEKRIFSILSISFIFLSGSIFFIGISIIVFLYYYRKKLIFILLSGCFTYYFFYEEFYNRIQYVFIDKSVRTLSGRIEAFSKFDNFNLTNIIFGLESHAEITPLDSSYLFIFQYLGLIGLILFLIYKFYIFFIVYNLNRLAKYSSTKALCLILFIDFCLSFGFNANFSFICNLFIFSIFALDYAKFNNDLS